MYTQHPSIELEMPAWQSDGYLMSTQPLQFPPNLHIHGFGTISESGMTVSHHVITLPSTTYPPNPSQYHFFVRAVMNTTW